MFTSIITSVPFSFHLEFPFFHLEFTPTHPILKKRKKKTVEEEKNAEEYPRESPYWLSLFVFHSFSFLFCYLGCGIQKTGIALFKDQCFGFIPGFRLFSTLFFIHLSASLSFRHCGILVIVSLFFHYFFIFSLFFISGYVYVNGKGKEGNSRWNEKGREVMMEVNMSSTPRTLRFFVSGKQGQLSVMNIPSSIQFCVSSFFLSSFSLFPFLSHFLSFPLSLFLSSSLSLAKVILSHSTIFPKCQLRKGFLLKMKRREIWEKRMCGNNSF
jgi:hypothetical protein